ncbi:histidinol-phosphate transaminase [Paenibacillus filicis]|uniref:Histidinol-phosphate aminotransferase n=1 Tax=Paenibacillus gyeongsangnamensis TaxID=3388067 RepID=A0ABT4QFP3_9BACL|nr:histidinol-phosphate transaminase [Paenibacillus filicis]MCZ8515700.1 histidinol-phosphate transaminase [Paenibacillus filicis]
MSDSKLIEARPNVRQIKPYSPGKPIWEVKRELGLEEVVKLASNENPLGPSPKAVEAIIRSLSELHRYPDVLASELKQELARRLGLSERELIVTNGADELITLISETYLEPGDDIVIPAPVFGEYEFGAKLMGANVKAVPLEPGFGYDVSRLLAAVTPRTKLLYLCSPHNPAGTYLPAKELDRLLAALPEKVLLVLDAAYSHYATAEDYTDGLEHVRAGRQVLVLQTFSKIYGLAGIRVGFGAAPAAVIESILKVKEPFNVNALAQAAAAAALADEAHLEASRRLNTAGREQLYAAFRKLGIPYTESMSNFVLCQPGPAADSIAAQLLSRGIIVRSGGTWGLPEHIRVSVGTAEENDKFIRALDEIMSLNDLERRPEASQSAGQ